MTTDQATDIVDAMCGSVRYVAPVPDDPQYAQVVRDPDDAIVLRTAAGIYFHADLATYLDRYIVSGDTHAFPPGRDWYGFRYRTASEFQRELRGGEQEG